MKLNGKVAIVTGGSSGLGLEIARRFALAGANVMICSREESQLEKACEQLRGLATGGQKIEAMKADVSKEHDVQALFQTTLQMFGGCHILVNNAGIYGPMGETESVDWSEWVKTIEVNLLGSVLMCRAVLEHFKSQKFGKIIQLSGGGATNPLPRITAYAASKAAIVRFSETLASEVSCSGIDVNCIAPGALNTRMLSEVLEAGPEKVGQTFYDRSVIQQKEGGAPIEIGAELAVFLASDESNGITGKLISAVWDRWEIWSEYKEELAGSDAYTLRRITGRDRGLTWGDK